jgi:membrane protein YdbS with pleckstrin-like domain
MEKGSVNLQEGENEIVRGKVHPAAFIIPLLVLIVGIVMWVGFDEGSDLFKFVSVVLMAVGAWRSIIGIGAVLMTRLVLTSERLIAQTGPFPRKEMEVPIHHVDRVEIKRGGLGRILGYGTLTVTARGEGNLRMKFSQITGADDLGKEIRGVMTTRSKQSRATRVQG